MKRRVRSAARGPARTWVGLGTGWLFTSATVTTAQVLMSLQAPTTLALTSDPPEDLVIDRIVGDFLVDIAGANASWILALTVQDTTWTPSTAFIDDADKRLLWVRQYNSGANALQFLPPGWINEAGVSGGGIDTDAVRVDITPKVRIEPGQALYLVAYEVTGTSSLTVSGTAVRMLFHRARRSR